MNEREPEQQPGDPPEPRGDAGLWDPREQVGDVYEVDIDTDGRVTRADKLDGESSEADPNSSEQDRQARPSIWVGSWLDYNNGVLHGDWIPADRDDADIWTDIQSMLANSPTAASSGEVAEDWGIFDYENFGSLRIGEQETVTWVARVARGIAEHGLAFAAWADVMEDEAALDGFADSYLGHYESVGIYAEQLVYDLGYNQTLDEALPDNLRGYVQIDTSLLGRDMQLGGDIHALPAEDGGVWIFDAHS